MITETINYQDFDGEMTTEEMYFNLTKLELTELAMDLPDELTDKLGTKDVNPTELLGIVTKELGRQGIIDFVKRMVLKAYGVKRIGQDGKMKFVKPKQAVEDFEGSIAFQEFVMELISNDDKATAFFNGVIPSEIAAQIPAAGIAQNWKIIEDEKCFS